MLSFSVIMMMMMLIILKKIFSGNVKCVCVCVFVSSPTPKSITQKRRFREKQKTSLFSPQKTRADYNNHQWWWPLSSTMARPKKTKQDFNIRKKTIVFFEIYFISLFRDQFTHQTTTTNHFILSFFRKKIQKKRNDKKCVGFN